MTRRGHEFDAIELVVSSKWRDSGCLFLVAPAKEAVRKSTKAAKGELQQGCACFETRPAGAPQHEVSSLIALRKFLILRRLRSSRLEGRTTLIPPIRDFLTAAFAGMTVRWVNAER